MKWFYAFLHFLSGERKNKTSLELTKSLWCNRLMGNVVTNVQESVTSMNLPVCVMSFPQNVRVKILYMHYTPLWVLFVSLTALVKYNWQNKLYIFKMCNLISFNRCVCHETIITFKIMNILTTLGNLFSFAMSLPLRTSCSFVSTGNHLSAFSHYKLVCI